MSSAKEMVLDFVNFIFIILLIGLCILYFIAGDNFDNFKNILRSLSPLASLGVLFLIRLKFWRERGKKMGEAENSLTEINITFFDRLKIDLFVFSLPAVILLASFILNKEVVISDVVIAVIVFIISYSFEKWLLGKAK